MGSERRCCALGLCPANEISLSRRDSSSTEDALEPYAPISRGTVIDADRGGGGKSGAEGCDALEPPQSTLS